MIQKPFGINLKSQPPSSTSNSVQSPIHSMPPPPSSSSSSSPQSILPHKQKQKPPINLILRAITTQLKITCTETHKNIKYLQQKLSVFQKQLSKITQNIDKIYYHENNNNNNDSNINNKGELQQNILKQGQYIDIIRKKVKHISDFVIEIVMFQKKLMEGFKEIQGKQVRKIKRDLERGQNKYLSGKQKQKQSIINNNGHIGQQKVQNSKQNTKSIPINKTQKQQQNHTGIEKDKNSEKQKQQQQYNEDSLGENYDKDDYDRDRDDDFNDHDSKEQDDIEDDI